MDRDASCRQVRPSLGHDLRIPLRSADLRLADSPHQGLFLIPFQHAKTKLYLPTRGRYYAGCNKTTAC
jgi:hypothetical protein